MSKVNFADIADDTKQAREATLVGKYDDAIVYYESVIETINRHVKQTRDQNSKQKWQQVRNVLELYVLDSTSNNPL